MAQEEGGREAVPKSAVHRATENVPDMLATHLIIEAVTHHTFCHYQIRAWKSQWEKGPHINKSKSQQQSGVRPCTSNS